MSQHEAGLRREAVFSDPDNRQPSGHGRRNTETDDAETFERMSRAGRTPVIGLDLRPTEPGFKAHFGRGTGRYATELIAALTAMISAEGSASGLRSGIPPIQLRALGGSDLSPSEYERRLVEKMPLGRMTIETQLLFPFRVKRCASDMVHFFHHGDAPAWCPLPYLVTVLDLIPLKFAALYQSGPVDWRYKLARWLELRSIRSASGILAISEATKNDLIEILKIAPERIVVTRLAVGPQFNPGGRFFGDRPAEKAQLEQYQAGVRMRLGLAHERPLLLYVGGIDQRKQVPFLLDVLRELLAGAQPGTKRPQLVLAGNYQNDRHFPALKAAIAEQELGGDVKLTGYLPEQDLLDLYRAADLVLFPSLYEGFGFPVLEAISCGTPVLARSNSSIPEVVGAAASEEPLSANGVVLIPDSCPAAVWAAEICRLLADPEIRLQMSSAGVKRAGTFSWERTARETLFAYKQFSISCG